MEKLAFEKLRDLRLKCDEPMGIKWERQMESMGEKRNACRELVGKPEGNIPPSRCG